MKKTDCAAAAAALFVSFVAAEVAFCAPGPEQLLERLREADAVYCNNVTLEGAVVTNWTKNSGFGPVASKWRMTISEGAIAIVSDTVQTPSIEFVKGSPHSPSIHIFGANSYDPSGNMIVSVPARETIFSCSEYAGRRVTDTIYRVSPANAITQSGQGSHVSIYHPGALGRLVSRPVWSAGRGFADYLDKMTIVEETPDGMLEVTATGRLGMDTPGVWKLTIDPAADYIVRKATCTCPGSTSAMPECTISTSGAVWMGRYCLPEKGSGGGREFTFVSVRQGADADLLAEALAAMKPPFAPGTDYFDERSDPPIAYATPDVRPSEESLRQVGEDVIKEILTSDSAVTAPVTDSITTITPRRPDQSPSKPDRREGSRAGWILLAVVVSLIVAAVVARTRRRA